MLLKFKTHITFVMYVLMQIGNSLGDHRPLRHIKRIDPDELYPSLHVKNIASISFNGVMTPLVS